MNKRELIGEVARRTGYAEEVCTRVLDTFEEVLGDAVADKVILGGKLTILILSLPIIESVLKLMSGFLELI